MPIELNEDCLHTPAFLYDQGAVLETIRAARRTFKQDIKLLFSLKSFSVADGLTSMAQEVDGFSASSLFEARLARSVLGRQKPIHITTPGLRPDEIESVAQLCDCISFNSISQMERYQKKIKGKASVGLRINPGLAFVEDDRYNPCRRHSKLGVSISELKKAYEIYPDLLKPVKGIHFHTNCESYDYMHLAETARHIMGNLPDFLDQIFFREGLWYKGWLFLSLRRHFLPSRSTPDN